jgi:tetratricopeptide (TPR) repeat protein
MHVLTTILCREFMRDVAKVAAAVFMTAALAQAQSGSDIESGTNFQGQVRYENNAPAQFVQVELWTDGESSWRTFATTDRAGRFHTGAPCMVIQYKIEAPGYRPVWGRVDMSVQPCRAHELMTLKGTQPPTIPGSGAPASGVIDERVAAIPVEARHEFEAGQKAVNGDDFAGAIPRLQKAISLYPRYAEAYQLLGVAQLQTHQGPQAESSLTKAIEIEDRLSRAQYLLGVLYAMTNRANLAEKPLKRFAELDPQNPDAHFELAKVSFALSKFPDAEMYARKSIMLKESNAGVHVVLGYALLRQTKAKDAKQSFQQFLKLDPNSPMAPDVRNTIAQIDQRANK